MTKNIHCYLLNQNYYETKIRSGDNIIILIPPVDAHWFPWEIMPVLRSKPVVRNMNINKLYDLITKSHPSIKTSIKRLKSDNQNKDLRKIDNDSVAWIINPRNDLPGIQTLFSPYISKFYAVFNISNTNVISNRPPTSHEFINLLSNNDLLM